ncbi:hypothetical protein Droror1_Dr00000637 [Drosera rotundifolia]
MAYRRSVITRAYMLSRQYHPSVYHLVRLEEEDSSQPAIAARFPSNVSDFLLQQTRYRTRGSGSMGTGLPFGWHKYKSALSVLPVVTLHPGFCRLMSTSMGNGSDKVNYIKDVAEVLTDKTVEVVTSSQAPVVSEVAAAAADSAFPVAALQYLIDSVHSFTGWNWWASIALTTILIRGVTLPLLINQLKSTSKLNLIRPQLEEIQRQVRESDMDPTVVAAGQKKIKALFNEHGVTAFTPLKGLLIQGPVFMSFFFAISNMVEKVPSFKVGGVFWFTDLTTTDSLYVLPVLASLSFLITVECNVQEGLEGNPIAGTMKTFSRVLAVLTVPFTATFPKALFCYWITSNLFSLSYGLALKLPQVRKFLDLPEAPLQTTPQSQPGSSPVFSLKQLTSAKPEPDLSPVKPEPDLPPAQAEVVPEQRRISSHAVLNQRIRNLEKQVKGRKKAKKP